MGTRDEFLQVADPTLLDAVRAAKKTVHEAQDVLTRALEAMRAAENDLKRQLADALVDAWCSARAAGTVATARHGRMAVDWCDGKIAKMAEPFATVRLPHDLDAPNDAPNDATNSWAWRDVALSVSCRVVTLRHKDGRELGARRDHPVIVEPDVLDAACKAWEAANE